MGSHFPTIKPRELIKLLLAYGFEERRITGSHHIFRHPQTGKIVTVPVHGNKDIKHGTLRSILRQAGLSPEDLNKN